MVLPVAPSATSSVELKTGRRMILDSPVYSSNDSLKVPKLSPTKLHSADRGKLLGTIRPIWRKVMESEARLDWLEKMVQKNLVVRNIDAYIKAQEDLLRSDEMKVKGEEREILFGLMLVKVKDEKRNLMALRKVREGVRNLLVKTFGKKKKYINLMKEIRTEMRLKRAELKEKFKRKLTILKM